MNKILVTGATGNLGKQILQILSSKTDVSNLFALVRDESKAGESKNLNINIRIGDYDNIESLKSAFAGIDKLFFISGSDVEKRLPQHKNVLDAAVQSGVKHVYYTSFIRKNETESSPIAAVSKAHIFTEDYLRKSGLKFTILRNTLYMEFLPFYMGNKVIDTRMIYLPADDGKVAFLLRSDMAEIAANILTSEGHENKIYTVAGEEASSYADIAKTISKITGKKIKYVSPPVNEFVKTMQKAGVPEGIIGMNAGFAQAVKKGEFETFNPEISKLLGRKPVTIEEFLGQVYA